LQHVDRDRLRDILGEHLARYAELIPDGMAIDLLRDDRGFIARYQLSEALLAKLTPEMRGWQTPDVLRALYPRNGFSGTRMQSIAGALAAVSCRAFPAFCYYPYVPVGHMAEARSEAPLIVAVHGSSRNPKDLRDAYAQFAERHGCFVLAPLFPMDLSTAAPDEEYKQLIGEHVRFDAVLWAMVEELAAATGTRFTKVLLFGFSGGAQFAQRLFYVDPARLDAVSLGAPSYVTLPDRDADWWTGLRDFEARFGKRVDFEAMRRVPVQLLCGDEDNLDVDIYTPAEMGIDDAAYAAYGRNRLERLAVLRDAYAGLGIASEMTLVPGAGHAFGPLLEASKPFFEQVLGT
jgi:pimeloyl-ACP methyl ester carboxylesterase